MPSALFDESARATSREEDYTRTNVPVLGSDFESVHVKVNKADDAPTDCSLTVPDERSGPSIVSLANPGMGSKTLAGPYSFVAEHVGGTGKPVLSAGKSGPMSCLSHGELGVPHASINYAISGTMEKEVAENTVLAVT